MNCLIRRIEAMGAAFALAAVVACVPQIAYADVESGAQAEAFEPTVVKAAQLEEGIELDDAGQGFGEAVEPEAGLEVVAEVDPYADAASEPGLTQVSESASPAASGPEPSLATEPASPLAPADPAKEAGDSGAGKSQGGNVGQGGKTAKPNPPKISYSAHVKGGKAATARKSGGQVAGSKSAAGPVDTVTIWVDLGGYSGSAKYKAYVNGKKWTEWKASGASVGSKSKRVTVNALKVALSGDVSKHYDVAYRTYLSKGGWQPWVVNGAKSGAASGSRYVKAFKVKLVKKGSTHKVENGCYAITRGLNANAELTAKGANVVRASYSTASQKGKFFLRNEKGGVTVQSVATGKFITAGKSIALKAWSGSNAQVWRLSWDGGLRLTNKSTGKQLLLTSSKATQAKAGEGFFFSKVRMLGNGTYRIENAAASTALSVSGANWSNGANIKVLSGGVAGTQVFSIKRKSGDWYKIGNVMTGKAVSVASGSAKSGANVRQWASNSRKDQLWTPGIARSGAFYFTNKASGKALTARKSAASGANVVSSRFTGAKAQTWKLAPASWKFSGDRSLDRYVIETAASNGFDLRRCFNWMGNLRHVQSVDSRIHWGIMNQGVVNSYVVIAKNRRVADCYTDAAMFCMLARACGFSANMRAGGCPSASRGTVPHGWTEVYANGRTYVCDANLRRDLPSYNWYMVGYANTPVVYTL